MTLIELEERKQIQMQILDAVDKFCEEHQIRYSLACGTLLGAARHGGYIPWDDDIDIYLLRDDYMRFEKLFPELLNQKYRLNSPYRTSGWNRLLFAKVEDIRTVIHEYDMDNANVGLDIDIFIIDDVPDAIAEFNKWNKSRIEKVIFHNRSFQLPSRKRSLGKNLAIVLAQPLFWFYNKTKKAKELDEFVQSNNGKGYKHVFETTQGRHCKTYFEKALFDDIRPIKFEDREYMAFADYDQYLRMTFGPNYMTPPPENKRASLHTYDAYWRD